MLERAVDGEIDGFGAGPAGIVGGGERCLAGEARALHAGIGDADERRYDVAAAVLVAEEASS